MRPTPEEIWHEDEVANYTRLLAMVRGRHPEPPRRQRKRWQRLLLGLVGFLLFFAFALYVLWQM